MHCASFRQCCRCNFCKSYPSCTRTLSNTRASLSSSSFFLFSSPPQKRLFTMVQCGIIIRVGFSLLVSGEQMKWIRKRMSSKKKKQYNKNTHNRINDFVSPTWPHSLPPEIVHSRTHKYSVLLFLFYFFLWY